MATSASTTAVDLGTLESHLWEAANILRGPVDASDFKTFIFPLLFFKRISDVYDEEYEQALKESGGDVAYAQFAENHRFQIPEGCRWQDVRSKTTNVGQAIQRSMREIEMANPNTLYSIFGDTPWSNKDRLSDALLRDLVEHFSRVSLANRDIDDDILGQAYEYLIKKFADQTNRKAGEFYTPRSVVRLMVNILDPKEGETIYDPTCGTAGMLLGAIQHVKEAGGNVRKLWGKLYGQEKNLTTSAIARINLFLHGIEDFKIVRGDTLSAPAFSDGDRLRQFDVCLANPPYSIKQWDRTAWSSDRFGRNSLGTPPQGRADYAFFGHILASLKPKTGRCAILFPHGVLFRDEEQEMRAKLVDTDQIECVLGLGPNLFYNSPMEACVVVCRTAKTKARRNRILFINAVNEVTRERAQSFLEEEHIQKILKTYQQCEDVEGFARVVTLDEIRTNKANLSIPLYVRPKADDAAGTANGKPLPKVIEEWQASSKALRSSMDALLAALEQPR